MARMLSRYPKRELQEFATAYKAKHPFEWAAIEPMILEEHELGDA